MDPQKMAFLGGGKVGQTLASGLLKHGHDVMIGSHEPASERMRQWQADNPEGKVGTYSGAAAWADWVFFCVPGTAVEPTVSAVGVHGLDGKIVVDVTNSLTTVDDDHLTLTWGVDNSAAAQIQRMAAGAKVVKALNSTGVRQMIDPRAECSPPDMPICGNDSDAKAKVTELLADIGWHAVDLGSIHSAGMIEALGLVWVQYGRMTGIWTHCYKFLQEKAAEG